MSELFTYVSENGSELLQRTIEHLWLTGISVLLAGATGIALGIWLTRNQRHAGWVIGAANIVQTIPSIALLGFMIPLVGIGAVPAIVALFLYALLPIIRNTYTGISEVAPEVLEAGLGLGMTRQQLLRKVELPLALPSIFAGLRTAAVINVGVATLCALIAAGGLGTFIFTGIALNNSVMILAGALPAALLAILIDQLLGRLQPHILAKWKVLLGIFVAGMLAIWAFSASDSSGSNALRVGMGPEFLERADGWKALKAAYNLDAEAVQMDPGLMYDAVKNGSVDAICGYSTDGRIAAFDLAVLEDDRQFFPPYYVAPMVRHRTLEKHPQLEGCLNQLAGLLTDAAMRQLNFEVDNNKETPEAVAKRFLEANNLPATQSLNGPADLQIGGKKFTEQYILLELFRLHIENQTGLNVELKPGLGGTKICFEAIKRGDIDLYPEYTGTGFLVLLNPSEQERANLLRDPDGVYNYVQKGCSEQYDLQWLKPLGFNNTYALMMRQEFATSKAINKISDL